MSALKIQKHIPNFFTLMNIVSGFIAIVFAFQDDLLLAFYFIMAAAFFDFVDGGVARLLDAQSEVGKQLDSLCDVVSFGVAPGVILFSMMRQTLGVDFPLEISLIKVGDLALLISVALVPAFSALRLAKFNVDTRQTSSFIGLPVPANALLISALGVVAMSSSELWHSDLLTNPYFLLALTLVQSYLLNSSLPMFALKFKNLKWKDNSLPFLFLGVSLFMIIFIGIGGIALSIIMYIVLSVILRILNK